MALEFGFFFFPKSRVKLMLKGTVHPNYSLTLMLMESHAKFLGAQNIF